MILSVLQMMEMMRFFDRIKNGYQAKIIEYPMVRVANADKTEQNEGVQQGKRPQGQQIGISESTYKQLKNM